MATYQYTFNSGDGVTPTRLNAARTVSDIVDADVSATAAIAATKLASDSITNTQIKSDAAIAGTKVAPNFGSQNVVTTGSVGAGTASPSVKLHVAGTDGSTNTRLAGASYALRSQSIAATGASLEATSANESTYQPLLVGGSQTLFTISGTERMRLNSGGNACIGTTSDFSGYKLSVLGNSGSSVMRLGTTGGAVIYALFNYNGSVNTGSITTDTVNTSYNISSDYRLKENFRPISNALQRLLQLNPLKFKWKSANIESEGFVAHELAEVVPQAVTGAKDAINADTNEPEYQQVDASKVIPLLVAAVQELSAKVAALEAKQA